MVPVSRLPSQKKGPLKDRYPHRIAAVFHEALRWWNPSTMHQWDRRGTRKNATALTPTRGQLSHHSPGAPGPVQKGTFAKATLDGLDGVEVTAQVG